MSSLHHTCTACTVSGYHFLQSAAISRYKSKIKAVMTVVNVTSFAHWLNEDIPQPLQGSSIDPPHTTCSNEFGNVWFCQCWCLCPNTSLDNVRTDRTESGFAKFEQQGNFLKSHSLCTYVEILLRNCLVIHHLHNYKSLVNYFTMFYM